MGKYLLNLEIKILNKKQNIYTLKQKWRKMIYKYYRIFLVAFYEVPLYEETFYLYVM